MKIEEMYLIFSALLLGGLSEVVDAFWLLDHPAIKSHPFNVLNFFSLLMWAFAIYFTLKYSGLICRKKKRGQRETDEDNE